MHVKTIQVYYSLTYFPDPIQLLVLGVHVISKEIRQ